MRQLIYAMRFTGSAAPLAGSSSVMRATTTAPSCRLTTVTRDTGVGGGFETVAGAAASFESEVTLSDQPAFREAGTIRFSTDHTLSFSTVGQGYLADSAEPGLKHGTVTWRVDRGTGQFAGASGLITSNFTIDSAGNVIDHHFGLIFIAEK